MMSSKYVFRYVKVQFDLLAIAVNEPELTLCKAKLLFIHEEPADSFKLRFDYPREPFVCNWRYLFGMSPSCHHRGLFCHIDLWLLDNIVEN